MDDDAPERSSRMRWIIYGALGTVILAPLVLGIVWTQRRPIARDLIDDLLKKRGVEARYDLTEVGTRLQRIENVVIGNRANPDLTVDWAEVDTVTNFFGWEVKRVRASGVRVKGRLVKGQLSFGSLDKLLPAASGEPFKLPDMDVALTDARMRLDTAFGPVGARLDGSGNFATNFKGKLALVAPRIEHGDCRSSGLKAFVDIGTRNRIMSVRGPVRAEQIACGNTSADGLLLSLDAKVPERFDRWSGYGELQARRVAAPGIAFQSAVLKADFTGDQDLSSTKANLTLEGGRIPGGVVGPTEVGGTFRFAPRTTMIDGNGTVTSSNIRPDGQAITQLTSFSRAGAGTPVAPIVAQLTRAVDRLREGSEGKARFTLSHEGSDGALRLNSIDVKSASGAQLAFSGTDPVRYSWRDGGLFFGGEARLSGGGFPASQVEFSELNGRWSGVARIAPLAAGETRITLAPVDFSIGRGGTSIATRARIDGRMGNARFVGLDIPVALKPGAAFLAGCQPLAFERLDIAGLNLGATRLQTCISGNQARFSAPQIAGVYAGTRFSAKAASAQYDLSTQQAWVDALQLSGQNGATRFQLNAKSGRYGANGAVALDQIGVRLNNGDSRSNLDLAEVDGQILGGKGQGRFSGATGKLGNVPLDMSEGSGRWRFAGNALSLDGRVRVADSLEEPRFVPLVSNDFSLRYAGGRITGQGTLTEPLTATRIASVSLLHLLSNGTGRADLNVQDLVFDKRFQPEQLTRSTLGVIANVEGRVSGTGQIRWTPRGVTSNGRFTTKGMDFAAAFGPVRQLAGDIVFSDLLGLETGPGQSVNIAEINSGVQVIDGIVRYRLLPGRRVEVEGGRWPFSGGELLLEPTVLDLSETSERRLTFRIIGLDSAKFINQLQLENISATGTFDGVLPMIFDKSGGRIEAGNIIARDGGGTLSYIGEVSKENLGTFGSIAFDALKSMRYRKLAIDLGGPLDGEMVTQVRFDGVNQAPIVPGRQKFPIPIRIQGLTGIPFIFNVTIRAPFRGLLTMSRSFQDPSGLIQQELEREKLRQDMQNQTEAEQPVQQ